METNENILPWPKESIKIQGFETSGDVLIPRINTSVPAGFPSPAMDYSQDSISLDSILIKHPSATFIIESDGDSMIGAFISNPARLIIDRAIQPRSGDIVLAAVNGEFTTKYYVREGDAIWLKPANNKYKPLKIVDGMQFQVWGVVMHIIVTPRNLD